MYHFILDNILLPVAPESLTMSVKNQNISFNLINDGEVNLVKSAGLTSVKFQALLPQVEYPFAQYLSGFRSADYFIDFLQNLKATKKVFQFMVVRFHANSNQYHTTNLRVALENFTTIEKASNGADILVEITLKEYVDFSTKTCNISFDDYTISTSTIRETNNSPISSNSSGTSNSSNSAKSYTVVKGDCLWNIAKHFYGDGSKYPTIYNANKSLIDGDNKGTGNPLYTIYPNQVFVIPAI